MRSKSTKFAQNLMLKLANQSPDLQSPIPEADPSTKKKTPAGVLKRLNPTGPKDSGNNSIKIKGQIQVQLRHRKQKDVPIVQPSIQVPKDDALLISAKGKKTLVSSKKSANPKRKKQALAAIKVSGQQSKEKEQAQVQVNNETEHVKDKEVMQGMSAAIPQGFEAEKSLGHPEEGAHNADNEAEIADQNLQNLFKVAAEVNTEVHIEEVIHKQIIPLV